MVDVVVDIDGEVIVDGVRSGGKGVGGIEEDMVGFDGVMVFLDYGGNGVGGYVCWRGSG